MAKTKKRSVKIEHRLALPNLRTFRGSVDAMDVIIGGVVGLGGAAGIQWALDKYAKNSSGVSYVPAALTDFMPALTGLGAGVLLYMAQAGKNPTRAKGHLVGATAAGVSIVVWGQIKKQFTFAGMGGYQLVNLGGLRVRDPGYAGMLVRDGGNTQQNLSDLTKVNLIEDDDSRMAI